MVNALEILPLIKRTNLGWNQFCQLWNKSQNVNDYGFTACEARVVLIFCALSRVSKEPCDRYDSALYRLRWRSRDLPKTCQNGFGELGAGWQGDKRTKIIPSPARQNFDIGIKREQEEPGIMWWRRAYWRCRHSRTAKRFVSSQSFLQVRKSDRSAVCGLFTFLPAVLVKIFHWSIIYMLTKNMSHSVCFNSVQLSLAIYAACENNSSLTVVSWAGLWWRLQTASLTQCSVLIIFARARAPDQPACPQLGSYQAESGRKICSAIAEIIV